ncbi:MAG: type IV pilus assembly protein PilM [Candidatus Pacebacteria bacterium]|nr:type IV pilus assembly protein PilM [Candidatus Paceibacterota bacterium]
MPNLGKFLDVNKFIRMVSGKKGSVLGIDIGSSAIKVIQLGERKGKVVLENYGELALGPYAGVGVGQSVVLTKTKIKEALGDILREANISGTQAILSIPMGSALLSLIELPKVDRKQLNSMIPLEARKYIPVPVSEVMLDWWILPRPDDTVETEVVEEGKEYKKEKTEVLLAAIHNDTVEKYKDIKSVVNIPSSSFEIDIFSAIRSVVGRDNSVVMVVDMGAGTTKLAVVDFGILRMQHIINMGSQDVSITVSKMLKISIDEAEKIKREEGLNSSKKEVLNAVQIPLNHIASEINKVIANYRKKHSRPITRIVLTGGGVLLKGFSEFARTNINVPVEVGDPFSRVETPVFLKDTLKEAGPEFAVALGLAIKAIQE